MTTVYRWQDKDGRGPYRAPLSFYWKDSDHEQRNPGMFDEFGLEVLNLRGPKEHLGCAFRSVEQMLQWFNAEERRRLETLAYEFVEMDGCRVLAESSRQLVIARAKPLRIAVRRVEVAA